MKNENRQNSKKHSEGTVCKKGIFASFNTPIKGILDIFLIMAITTIAVMYLGPIVIGSSSDAYDKNRSYIVHSDYICLDTGRIIKDYLIDENGEKFGWIDIEYHNNGNFMRVTEHNERDNTIVKVYYSEENEFLYWYEIKLDGDGNVISSIKYGADGHQIY